MKEEERGEQKGEDGRFVLFAVCRKLARWTMIKDKVKFDQAIESECTRVRRLVK